MIKKPTLDSAITLIVFSFFAAFTSQSLMDFADILLVGFSFYIILNKKQIKYFTNQFVPFWHWIVWIFVIFISLLINNLFYNLEAWLSFLEFKWIMTFLSIIYLSEQIQTKQRLFNFISGVILFLNFLELILYYLLDDQRAAGIFNAVMAFSHNIAPIFCLFTVLTFINWEYLQKSEKLINLLNIITAGALTLFTYTRGVWIGSFIGIIGCLFIWNAKKTMKISFFIIAGIIFLIFANQTVYNRVFSKTALESDSNSERLALWKANFRIVQDNPIFGVGFDQNKNHIRKYYDEMGYPEGQRISHAHNQYLQIWAGTGTVGLLCFLYFMFLILKKSWSGYKIAIGKDRGLVLGLISALICFLIGAITEANFNISKNRFLFLLIAGLAIGFSNQIIKSQCADSQHREK